MEIKILGMGCAKCQILWKNTQTAVQELGLDAQLEKVEDLQQIIQYGAMQTPALRVNGKIILSGQTPTPQRLKELLLQAKER